MMHVRGLRPVILALSLLAVPAFAGSPADPEVDDERGDVDVQHLVDADVLDSDASPEELETSADVVKAWIDMETQDSFTLNVELADIPDDENISSPLVEIWSHFTVRDGDYHAKASLSQPRSGVPAQASFALYLDETKVGELAGDVDAGEDVVSYRVPKADVRDPGEGDELSGFYVTTHVPDTQATLDYAPGTEKTNLLEDTDATSANPTDLDLSPTARYGDTYAFQSFEKDGSQISVDTTPPSLEIQAGEPGTYAIRIVNDAEDPDEASLSLSNTPDGWSAQLDPSSVTVPAHGSKTVTLYVTPADDAEGHALLDVNVVTSLGADKGASASAIALQAEEDAASETEDGTDPGPDAQEDPAPSSEENEAAEEADSIPAPSVAVVVAMLAALAMIRRRRG